MKYKNFNTLKSNFMGVQKIQFPFIISLRLPRASHGGKQACQANGME